MNKNIYSRIINIKRKNKNLHDSFLDAIYDPLLKNYFHLHPPPLEDISKSLHLPKCSVYALRFDKCHGAFNLKVPVFGGLILYNLLKFNNTNKDCFIDAGNVNSALSLKYFCNKLGVNGYFIMSRYFPEKIINNLSSNNFKVEKSPSDVYLSLEREFYSYLNKKISNKQFRKNKVPLWHAKYGSYVLKQIETINNVNLQSPINFFVTQLGAGSTFNYMRYINMKENNKIGKFVIAEHFKSQTLLHRNINTITSNAVKQNLDINPQNYGYTQSNTQRIKHLILGPHLEEINPFLRESELQDIHEAFIYNDYDWIVKLSDISDNISDIGNSSLVNLFVAREYAKKGNKVLTAILEPSRYFYKDILKEVA